MSEVYTEVLLRNKDKQIKKKLLVDTGATYSWIKSTTLKKLRAKPVTERLFETIEGKFIIRKVGFVDVECMGERAPTAEVFATKRDSELLGLHALEGLALEVDPISRKLRKSKAIKAI